MADYYDYIKALHIIFMVTWFAGLFYMPRLFVYQVEANEKPSPDREILGKQLGLMAKRLWKIITGPSLVLCSLFAFLMLHTAPFLLEQPWMQIKLGFVILLYIYHAKTWSIHKQLQKGEFKHSSKFMRIWNEGATLILFAVVFLAITKSATNWIYGVLGIIGLGVLLMLGIRLYRKIQEKNPDA
ncbi:CopD family protein [Dokdonia sp.]|uniref:CopD family protein n=1 Tax=Dokdonia sp. TaxID=2024995 RepID=UPI003267F87F